MTAYKSVQVVCKIPAFQSKLEQKILEVCKIIAILTSILDSRKHFHILAQKNVL